MHVRACESVIGVSGLGDPATYGFETIVFDKVYGSAGVIVSCQVRIDGGPHTGVIVFFVDHFQRILHLQAGSFTHLGCQFFTVDQACGMLHGFLRIFFGESRIGKTDTDGQAEHQRIGKAHPFIDIAVINNVEGRQYFFALIRVIVQGLDSFFQFFQKRAVYAFLRVVCHFKRTFAHL